MDRPRSADAGILDLLRTLRRQLWIVFACTVLVAAFAFVFSSLQEKKYSATAQLLFRDPGLDQKLFGSSYFPPSRDPSREAATNVKLVGLQAVAALTARALGNGHTTAEIRSKVKVAPAGEADVVSVTAVDASPTFAARVANGFAREYIAFRRDADRAKLREAVQLVQRQYDAISPDERDGEQAQSLRKQAEQLEILASLQTGNAELVQPAVLPSSPSSPRPRRNGMLGGLLGLALGVLTALILERVNRRVREPSEVEAIFDRPILAAVPALSRRSRTNDGVEDANALHLSGATGEVFQMLRANLQFFNIESNIRSVLVTSPGPGEGKSTIARHLAAASASLGTKTLLIEADLRRPTLAKTLLLDSHHGLTSVLTASTPLDEAVQKLPVGQRTNGSVAELYLDVLVAGPMAPNPTDLLASQRMKHLLEVVQHQYDLVIIDTPPVLVVSDATPLLKEVDGVVVVARMNQTMRDAVEHLRKQLDNVGARTLGVVANYLTESAGGYGYSYEYEYTSA